MGDAKLSVLLVDDNQRDLDHIARLLKSDCLVSTALGAEQALSMCAENSYDCVLTDYYMAGVDGLTFIERLRGDPSYTYVPVLMMSAQAAIDVASKAFKTGADDYLSKDDLSTQYLLYAIKSAVVEKRLLEAQEVERHGLVTRNLELERRHELMSEYWQGVAQNIVTPLTAIREYVSLVLDGVGGDISEAQFKYLSLARGGCAGIESIVDQLVRITDLSRDPQLMSWGSHDLCVVIDELVDEFRLDGAGNGTHITTQFDILPRVFAERAGIGQLFYLLLSRCLWHAGSGGSIHIRCEDAGVEPKRVRVSVSSTSAAAETLELEDHMHWQLTDALERVNGRNLDVQQQLGGICYSLELMTYVSPAALGDAPERPGRGNASLASGSNWG